MCAWIEYLNLHAMLGKSNIYYPIWWFHGDECHGTKWRNHLGVVGSTCFSRIPCHLTIYAECRSKEPCRRALFLTVSSQNNPNPKNFKIWRKNRWKYIEYSNTCGKLYECIILISTRCHKKMILPRGPLLSSYKWSSGAFFCYVVLACFGKFSRFFAIDILQHLGTFPSSSVHLKQCALDLLRSQWCSPWGPRLVVPTSFAPIW